MGFQFQSIGDYGMKKLLMVGASVIAVASASFAQGDRVFDLPMLTQAPVLDGVIDGDEWAGSLELGCSPSQVQADGAEYGWRDIEAQQSEVSVNQLAQSDGEDAAIARTDADFNSRIWQAWNEDGLWVATAAADNAHDVEGGENGWAWWERDSLSLYVDLVNEKEEAVLMGEYTALNIINFQARPLESSPYTVSWARTVEGARSDDDGNDPDLVEGFLNGYRDADDEFGGEADYVIEMFSPWENLMRFNLPATPTVGTEMGFSWLPPDPDGDDGYGGQLQCWGWADDPSNFSTWVFSDTPAGPAGGSTAVEEDSWGRIKSTFQ
jgi:hypothetical protein